MRKFKVLSLFIPAALFLVFIVVSTATLAVTFNDPLVDAADASNKELVANLLKQGHYPDSKGDFGTTALMRAAFRGDIDIVQMLIDNGAYVNAADAGGETPLHLAAKNGHTEVVKELIYYDAYVDIPDKEQWTPLMRATMAKKPEVAKILLEKGADVTALNNSGESVLVHASIAGLPEIVSMVTGSSKADKITKDQEAKALEAAKRRGNKDVSEILANFTSKNAPLAEPEVESVKISEYDEATPPPLPEPTDTEKRYNLGKGKAIKVDSSWPKPKKADKTAQAPAETAVADIKPEPLTEPKAEAIPEEKPVKQPEKKGLMNKFKLNKETAAPKPLEKPKTTDLPVGEPTPAASIKPTATPPEMTKIPVIRDASLESSSSFFVQLGTFRDDPTAEKTWDKIIATNSDFLGKYEPTIVQAILSSAPGDFVYRLRAGTISNKNEADILCKNLRARNQECYVVEVSGLVPAIREASTEVPAAPLPKPITETNAEAPAAPATNKITSNYPKLSGTPVPVTAPTGAPIDIAPEKQAALPPVQPAPAQDIPQQAAPLDEGPLPWHSSVVPPRQEWRLPADEIAQQQISAPAVDASASEPVDLTTPPAHISSRTLEEAPQQPQTALPPVQQPQYTPTPPAYSPPAQAYNPPAYSPAPPPPPVDNKEFVENKAKMREEVNEMTRQEFFRKQGMEAPKRSEKEYQDFYKEIESNKESPVSEAVLVPDETYFSGNAQAPSQAVGPGSWLNIYNLPNEEFANDYAIRMFKYDESLGNVQIMVMKPVTTGGAPAGVSMRVGPLSSRNAVSLCENVRAGGYGCSVVGDGEGTQPKAATIQTASAVQDNQGYWINLGTFANGSEAEYYWMFLKDDNSDIMEQLKYDMPKADHGSFGSDAVQLLAGPFGAKQQAIQLCNLMRYRNIACLAKE